MNVLYLSEQDPRDATSWSGILLSMYKSLLDQDIKVSIAAQRTGTLWGNALQRVIPGDSESRVDAAMNRCHRLLETDRIELVFAPVASLLVSRLKSQIPVVYFSDGTLKSVYGSLPFSKHYRLHGSSATTTASEYQLLLQSRDRLERAAMLRSARIVYPSQWAYDSAIQDYGISKEKVSVIPIGANIPTHKLPRNLPQRQITSPIKLLYIGTDWERKGGPVVLEALESLEQRGLPARLTIVGCTPAAAAGCSNITVIPYLNKNSARARREFEKLLVEHHFFLLPSRAEAYGIAPAEAMAYGLPALVSGVGGLSTVVKDGVGGFVLSPASSGEDYADKIAQVVKTPNAYHQLSISAFNDYHQRLDWSHFGRQITQVFAETIDGN